MLAQSASKLIPFHALVSVSDLEGLASAKTNPKKEYFILHNFD
jgi:hypothetical protein